MGFCSPNFSNFPKNVSVSAFFLVYKYFYNMKIYTSYFNEKIAIYTAFKIRTFFQEKIAQGVEK